jgi:hypothetical protein
MTAGRPRVLPNFFIVGAPKCGTTSIYEYLCQHPEVFMTRWKEPHFWSTDLYRPGRISEERYYGLFEEGAGKRRVGEASTEYLYSAAACENIKRVFPDAKIIVMLRNPVDMIHSGHSQRLWHGRENIPVFEEALEAEPERKRGKRLPPYPYPVETLFYRDVGRYARHVDRYLTTFGRENVHVILFEELVKAPEEVFRQLCAFLGVSQQAEISFGQHNANKVPRFQKIPLLLVPTSKVRIAARSLPGPVHQGLRILARLIMKANTKREKRVPLRPETRRNLEAFFEDDVAELSAILGVDLQNYWFNSRTSPERETECHARAS